ncbi:MAG: type II toxin-antitoxin system RelE/ParE family toxin [Clostridia bacterium]|nr:type II toxin-antitoxin system RelE/ParE family toxin [Clostridia bacterium]
MDSEYKYRFTDKAVSDLDEILSYITNELCNAKAAKDLYSEIFEQIDNVCQFPESGTLIENEYLADKTIRRFLVDNYTVYYKRDDEAAIIYIVRLAYSRRNLNEIIKTLNN